MLQCVAVCCSVLQCVAVCCRVLQSVTLFSYYVCVEGGVSIPFYPLQTTAVCYSVLPCVAVCFRVLLPCVCGGGLSVAYCEVATISRLLQMIGLFCRISSFLYGSFAKETYHLQGPTSCSHSIPTIKKCVLISTIYRHIVPFQ